MSLTLAVMVVFSSRRTCLLKLEPLGETKAMNSDNDIITVNRGMIVLSKELVVDFGDLDSSSPSYSLLRRLENPGPDISGVEPVFGNKGSSSIDISVTWDF